MGGKWPRDDVGSDPINDAHAKFDKYAIMRDRTLAVQRKYGNTQMFFNNEPKLTMEDYEKGGDWSGNDLEAFADDLLRKDSKRELCRRCHDAGQKLPYGSETGYVEATAQYDDDGNPVLDDQGNQLYIDFPEFECAQNHRWFAGEGKRRDWDGPNPVLMEEHIKHRQRREIYVQSEEAMGRPDPSITSGIYNRYHKDGRKINSKEQRRKNGASYFR